MDASTTLPTMAGLVIAAGVGCRMLAAVAVATLPAFPGVTIRTRFAVAVALAAAVLPAAVTSHSVAIGPWPLVVAGEAIVGGVIGMAIALVVAASGWAGTVLGSVSGLSWADDFDPGSGEASAGIGRLAWWVGVAAFLAAGGQFVIVTGLLDSFAMLPVGTVLNGDGGFDRLLPVVTAAPALALRIALTLALPAITAVVAFHLASTICLRAVPFSPGAGLLQGLAAVVLLVALWSGLDAWVGTSSLLMREALQHVFK
ncbi:MAG: flagellar biosynthetic protein FliR [Planctomycetota bacterium]|jgi:flagellar biosynthetic protein FliR|nr:flagellar biosynthetic protein FliR [Planctomycetota bacterium]